MFGDISADELEKEIIFMEQELIFKRAMLDECRQKLNSEITEHAQTKSIATKCMNEKKELQLQLEMCLTGTQKLEEENKKNRELLVKLQVQLSTCLNERQQLLDSCYQNEKENTALKTELSELKEQLKGHVVFLENFKHRKTKTEALVTDIIKLVPTFVGEAFNLHITQLLNAPHSKQEALNKEQTRLELVCKEGLKFAEKVSEEAKFQIKFVREAKASQAKMENEIIRLMAAVSELRAEKVQARNEIPENSSYLELWKSSQKEMKIRVEELQRMNRRLEDELNFAKEQIEMLLKNYGKSQLREIN